MLDDWLPGKDWGTQNCGEVTSDTSTSAPHYWCLVSRSPHESYTTYTFTMSMTNQLRFHCHWPSSTCLMMCPLYPLVWVRYLYYIISKSQSCLFSSMMFSLNPLVIIRDKEKDIGHIGLTLSRLETEYLVIQRSVGTQGWCWLVEAPLSLAELSAK